METSMVVPDGGWGWFVLLGGFINTTLISMLSPCFGILFSRFLTGMGTSSTVTAWIFNIQCFIWYMMGPLVRPLTAEFGWRRVGVFGSLLASGSIILSAFTPSAEFLFFSFSLLSGVGGGLAVGMCYIIVPIYFDKRRGIANGVLMTGICVGQILGAPLVRFLQDEYGFQGATLILGGIILHGCVGSTFFHPVEWHMKKVSITSTCSDPENGHLLQPSGDDQKVNVTDTKDKDLLSGVEATGPCKELQASSQPSETTTTFASDQNGNCKELQVSSKDCIHTTSPLSTQIPNERNKWKAITRVVRATIADLRILKSYRTLIITTSIALCINAYFNFIMMVPFAMQAAGFTPQEAAWCISVSALCNLPLRLVMSALTDWPKFKIRAWYMGGFAVISATMFAFPLVKGLPLLVTTMAVWGSGLGTNITLNNLIMIKYMGIENLAPVFGATCIFIGVGFVVFGPITGVVRDVSDSYTVSMWMMAGMVFCSLILWIFMPIAVAYDDKRKPKG